MKKALGFTLIEIMISLVIGLIVIGATISIYIATIGSSSSTIKSSRLNYDIESVMTLMLNDIKRTGYWRGAVIGANTMNNLFTAGNTDILIPNTSTVVYSYDADNDGVVDLNECYGFRLNGTTIQMRTSVTSINDCNTTAGDWQEFIDGNQLTITGLEFSFTPINSVNLTATSRCWNETTATPSDGLACTGAVAGNNIIVNREVNIRLSGRVSSDTSVIKNLNGTVEVRNNRLYVQP